MWQPELRCPHLEKTKICLKIIRVTISVYFSADNEDFDREEIATYEEVARLFPRADFRRPVVLVGPPGVGRNEIKRRIIAMEPDRFKITTPRKVFYGF